MKEESKVLKWP